MLVPLPEPPMSPTAQSGSNASRAGEAYPPLILPGRRPILPAPARGTSSVDVALSSDTVARLYELARSRAMAADTIVLAAFVCVLHRHTTETKIALCSRFPSAARADSSLPQQVVSERSLGVDIGENPSFATVLDRIQHALDAARHPTSSESEPVARQPDGSIEPGRRPTIGFDLSLDAHAPESLPEAAAPVDDLRVSCTIEGETLRMRWIFARDAFDRSTIDRLAAHYARLLQAGIADPDIPVATIVLTDALERAERIRAGAGPRPVYERDAPIHELWTRQVHRTPQAVAVADLGTRFTYAEIDRRANRVARDLIARGIRPGTTVGVAFDRSIHLPATLLGILKAGGVYVPLDLDYPRERLDLMISDAAIRFIVSPTPLDEIVAFTGQTIPVDDRPLVPPAEPDLPPNVAVDACAGAYIMYTSGSTGRPKGVAVSHRGVVRLVRAADYTSISADDGFLQSAPLTFDASTFEIWGPLLNGGRLGIPRPGLLTIADLADAVERFGVTILFLTTSLFGRVADSGLAGFGRLRTLLTGGEVASPAHMCRFVERYPGCALTAVYGPTENTTFSTWHPLPTAAAIGTNVPIGRPIANSTAYVVDPAGEPVPIGVAGELWVGGDGVADGYLNLPEMTQERFVDDPFASAAGGRLYKTGDRVRWRSDDVLEFIGRTDDQVKIRGHRIELGEIERALETHPRVRSAAVVVDATGQEKAIVAFVVFDRTFPDGATEIRNFLAAKLPRFMLPHRFSILEALPEHASGKIDRVALARRAARTEPAPVAAELAAPARAAVPVFTRPGKRLQSTVAEVWSSVLGLDVAPDPDINFFDAGGDSLRLLNVHAALQEKLGVELAIMDLFEYTTIRKLAAFLETVAR